VCPLPAIKVTSKQLDEIIEPFKLIEVFERVLKSDASAPLRPSVTEKGSWFSSMIARGLGYYCVKLVGVYPNNPRRGLPLVRGQVLLFDADNGELLLEADATKFTAWRTAAATALALKTLGACCGTLGIIGAGVQGEHHLALLSQIMKFDKYIIYDIDLSKAERLAKRFGGEVTDLRTLLRSSDVIVSATVSRTPVILGELVKTGSKIASIGAPKPVKEVDIKAIERAGCVLVDTKEGVINEASCIEEALRKGVRFEMVELRDVVKGYAKCDSKEISLYKSVGTALFDLAMAIYILERVSNGAF
jgi:alanine dehydrogenase